MALEALESIGVDDLFPLIRRHSPQIAHGSGHHAPPFWRKLAELAEHLSCLCLLFGRQVFPGLHTIQHLQLLLRRQIGETLQTVPQHLLARGWQPPERGIVLERAFLLLGWKILIAA